MALQQVGFSIQGDVIGGASLIHTATGRLLKALSDGGIDFYAVAAAIQLGKHIPIQPSQEIAVTRLLATKTGSRAGFLAKALQIGWGHSVIAIELSKTRAGVSSLLTIGALTTGSTDFVAAQALSELMILHGCEPDSLPTIDVLKAMISYLAPFMHDFGFNKVFEHITSSLKRACALAPKNVLNGLLAAGEPTEWARAMKHLISTAALGETAYLCVEQRGAWLATYAVHVQCMAVKIVVDKVIMWEAAGTRGVAVIQLGSYMESSYIESSEIRSMIESKPGQGNLEVVAAPRTPAGCEPMQVTYPLGEALDKELSLDPRIDDTLKAAIRKGILRLVDYSMQTVTVQEMGNYFLSEPRKINGRFPNKKQALLLVCRIMGIIPGDKSEVQSYSWNTLQLWNGLGWKNWLTSQSNWGTGTLRLLDASMLCTLQQVCGCQQPGGSSSKTCFRLCGHVKGIIAGFAAAVLSLAQCVFDPSGLRLYANAVNGTFRSDLTGKLFNSTFEITDEIETKADEWLLHLSFLVHGEFIAKPHSNLLAVSVGSSSIYYRAILDKDCFDGLGRVIAICPGRISVANTMRNYVLDGFYGFSSKLGTDRFAGTSNVYPVGLKIKPHYAQGTAKVSIACSLEETAILLSCSICSEPLPSILDKGSDALNLCFQIGRFLQHPVPPPCHHAHDQPYNVTGNSGVQVATLGAAPTTTYNGLVLYATAGCTIEQMIQGCMLSDTHNSTKRLYGCFQGEACLECAVNFLDTLEERNDPKSIWRYIIMS